MLSGLFKPTNRSLRLEKKMAEQQQITEQFKISEAVNKYSDPDEEKLLSKIAQTDERILIKLSEIEANQVDEQDTSIRKASEEMQKTPSVSENPAKNLSKNALKDLPKNDSFSIFDMITKNIWSIIGVAGMAMIGFITALGKKPFELLDDLFKNGIKVISGLTELIADITAGVMKSVMSVIDPILKYVKDLIPDFKNPFSSADEALDITDKYNADIEKAKVTKDGINRLENVKMSDNAADVAKVTEKVVGKETVSALKSTVKKIPIIGLLAGIGFGISRALDGDLVGAGLEVASGAASMMPGFGTAASLAIDVGLVARDLAAPSADSGEIDDSVTSGKYVSDIKRHDVDNSLVEMIKRNEGFSATYYKDAHGTSIGYGHFSKGSGSIPVSQILGYEPVNGSITKKEAEILLEYDISRAQEGLFTRFPWVKEHPKSVQNNLIDMTYNLGAGGIAQFKETLGLIKSAKYADAGKNLTKTLWYTQVGNRAKNIVSDFIQLGNSDKNNTNIVNNVNNTNVVNSESDSTHNNKETQTTINNKVNNDVIPNKEKKEQAVLQNVEKITENTKGTGAAPVQQTQSVQPIAKNNTLAGSMGSTPDYSKAENTSLVSMFNN